MFGFLKKKKKAGEAEAEAEAEAEVEAAKPDAEGAEGGEGEAPAKKKLSGKKLILFIVLPAVLVLGGGGAAAFMLLSGGKAGGEQHAEAEAEAGGHEKAKGGHGGAEVEPVAGPHGTTISYGEGVVFVSMPEMLVNITGADGRPAFLKLRLTLEAGDDAVVAALTEHVPRVVDQFTGFLRELRTDDIAGSAGAYRLRLELLRRVNIAIAPAQISAVLIEEMLVQ